MTRKEQLGVEANEEPAPTSAPNRGRGKGRGRGRGRGKKQTVEMEDGKTDEQHGDVNENEVDDQDAGQEDQNPGDHVGGSPCEDGLADNTPNKKNQKKPVKAPKGKKAKGDEHKAPRPKATAIKRPAARKQKQEKEVDMENGDEKGVKREAPDAEAAAPQAPGEAKKARTWGGRWIPLEDGVALRKMKAVMQVWETALQNKFRSQSSLQSPFFKMCNNAFRAAEIDNDDTPMEKFVEVAEHQVVPFTKDETFSNWDVWISFFVTRHFRSHQALSFNFFFICYPSFRCMLSLAVAGKKLKGPL